MKLVSGLSKLQTDSYYLDTEENCVYVMTGKAPESFTAEIPDLGTGMVKTGTARHMLIEDCTFNNANGQGLEIEHGTGERIPENKRTGVYEG